MRVSTKWDRNMTHFIGRPSIFGNPFPITSKIPRETVIKQYEAWVRGEPEVLTAIKALPEDAVLGCFCAPKPCHGDIIVKLWKELHGHN
jgi:hypothetical protein